MVINNRRGVNQQYTFDYTTPNLQVSAQPTQQSSMQGIPDVVIPAVDTSASALVDFLNLGVSALTLYEKKIDIPNQEKEGKLAALKGEEQPNEGYYRVKTYFETKGQLDAQSNYKNEVAQYTEKYKSVLGAKDFQAGLNEITKKYLEGASSSYVEGFLPTAKAVEQQAIGSWTNTQIEQEKIRNTNLLYESIQNTNIEDVVNGYTSEYSNNYINEDIQNSLETLGTGKIEEENKTEANGLTGTTPEELEQKRQQGYLSLLKSFQTKGAALGIDKKTISAMFLSKVAQTAIEQGKPELLDFTDLKDDSGISLKTVFGDLIGKYKQEAIKTQYNIEIAQQKQEEAIKKQALTTFTKGVYVNISKIGLLKDPIKAAQEAGKLKAAILSSPEYNSLSPTTLKGMLSDIDKLMTIKTPQEKSKTVKSDPNAIISITQDMIHEELDVKDLISFYADGKITETDYKQYVNAYMSQEEEKEKKAAEEAKRAEEEKLKAENQQQQEEEELKMPTQTKQEITNIVNLTAQNLAGTDKATGMFLQSTLAAHKQALLTRAYKYIQQHPDGSLEDFTETVVKPYILSQGQSYEKIMQGSPLDNVSKEDNFNLITSQVQPKQVKSKSWFHSAEYQNLPEPKEVAATLKQAKTPDEVGKQMEVLRQKYNLDDAQVQHYFMQYGFANLLEYGAKDPYQQLTYLRSLGIPSDLYDEIMSAYSYYLANPY